VTGSTSSASLNRMRLVPLLPALGIAALLLAGCAESASAPDSNALSLPDKSDNPPVTMSGYVDTSTTIQVK
jgi:hypothetical protein